MGPDSLAFDNLSCYLAPLDGTPQSSRVRSFLKSVLYIASLLASIGASYVVLCYHSLLSFSGTRNLTP